MSVQNGVVLSKVEAVKEIRLKTLQLEELKTAMVEEVNACDREQKRINDFKSDMDSLLQEKMSHVEELRQIHSDINVMENAIKKAEEMRASALEKVKRVHEEYQSLKFELDGLRQDVLGLERLPDLHEDKEFIKPELLTGSYFERPFKCPEWYPPVCESVMMASFSQAAHAHAFQPPTTSFLPHVPHPLHLLPTTSKLPEARPVPPPPLPGPPPTFRQQPPPMKSCLSCHQQIHRNAPICPLCKAKSRSRNPKKPKKKE